MSGGAPAAWHPDPYGGAIHRYWDGEAWTDDVGPAEPQFGLAPIREAAGGTLTLAQSIGSGNDELRDDPQHEFIVTAGSWTFLDHAGVPVVTARLASPEGGTFSYGTGKTASTIVADLFEEAAARRELPLLTLLGVSWCGP